MMSANLWHGIEAFNRNIVLFDEDVDPDIIATYESLVFASWFNQHQGIHKDWMAPLEGLADEATVEQMVEVLELSRQLFIEEMEESNDQP